jgi:ubiquitin C-terminal hydrolase
VNTPLGIRNLGNTCYLNSVLQVLSHLPSVVFYFKKTGFSGRFLQHLRNCCYDLQAGSAFASSWVHSPYNPKELLGSLVSIDKRFHGSDQQDAHELFQSLMHHISTAVISPGLRLCLSSEAEAVNPFSGWVSSTMMCKACGWRRPSQEHTAFHDLSVPLPDGRRGLKSSVDLSSCLSSFFSEDLIEGVECLNCTLDDEIRRHSCALADLDALLKASSEMVSVQQAREEAHAALGTLQALSASTKSGSETASQEKLAMLGVSTSICSNYSKCFVVSRWPQILCFHLSRLCYDVKRQSMQKNSMTVRFPLLLSSTELAMCTKSLAVHPPQYALRAVVVHHGHAHAGDNAPYV